MKPFENEAELAAALREMRPLPATGFAAELDQRAAAGFPRDSRWGAAVAALRERVASTPPRRLIAPAGAFAVVAIVVATAVVATTDGGSTSRTLIDAPDSGTAAESHPSTHFEGTVPPAAGAAAPKSAREATGGDSAASIGSPETSSATSNGYQAEIPNEFPHKPSGPYAAQAGDRDIERSAEIVLGADPSEVRPDSAKVFEAVHAADGIVLSSSIRDGEAGTAGADFELLIPTGKLGDALASISAIAEVRSRHEATDDITAPTVSTGERLQDSRARIEGLLGQLADSDTDAERASVEAQLRSERYRAAALRSQLSSLERRANLSRVSLRIETGAHSSSGGGSGAGWGIGDGLDGAGRVLTVAAGVTVIGLAILAPFALIALLIWATRRAWLRRARREALRSA